MTTKQRAGDAAMTFQPFRMVYGSGRVTAMFYRDGAVYRDSRRLGSVAPHATIAGMFVARCDFAPYTSVGGWHTPLAAASWIVKQDVLSMLSDMMGEAAFHSLDTMNRHPTNGGHR